MKFRFRCAPTLLATALLAACASAPSGLSYRAPDYAQRAPEAASGYTEKPGWSAQKFMVAAANPLATDAGYQVLKAGGSAVDAAIAVQMVLGLVEPQSSGIGGGLFLVHHDGKRVQTYDGRETAPAAATPELFMKDGKPMDFMQGVVGGRSVGTPGTLRALELAHKDHGRLPWKALFQPAIQLAENGFRLSPRLLANLQDDGAKTLRNDPAAAAYFLQADGTPKPLGTVLRNPEFASVLRDIADRGPVAFYEGPVARDIVAKVRGHATNPGLLTEADLAAIARRCASRCASSTRRTGCAACHRLRRAHWPWGRCWACWLRRTSRRPGPCRRASAWSPARRACTCSAKPGGWLMPIAGAMSPMSTTCLCPAAARRPCWTPLICASVPP